MEGCIPPRSCQGECQKFTKAAYSNIFGALQISWQIIAWLRCKSVAISQRRLQTVQAALSGAVGRDAVFGIQCTLLATNRLRFNYLFKHASSTSGGCRAWPNWLRILETRDLRSQKWVIPSLRGPWVQIPPPAPNSQMPGLLNRNVLKTNLLDNPNWFLCFGGDRDDYMIDSK